MHFASALAAAPLVAAVAAFTPASTSGTDKLAAQGLVNLAKYEAKSCNDPPTCNISTGYIRQEWSTLSATQKTSYINAVLCLQSKPSKSGSLAPGAKSRYDDFVATHINQTLTIHGTGNFLSWHRYFVYTYETALRNECGYTGRQPYLNWGKYALDPLNAPVFDGSGTSMSNNGAYEPHGPTGIPSNASADFYVPAGNGSGCVTSGPFKNMSVNLGPVSPALANVPANPQPNGLGYNPRCLRRDISVWAAQTALQDANTTALISDYNNIGDFQTVMQGLFAEGLIGVHTAGHFLVGGDPGGDIFSSPGDPYFFLHHAQIDRVWWIWQNQDVANRQNAIAGTITLDNEPPSRNTTLQDLIDLGVNAPGIPISSAMSTLGTRWCYVYA